MYFFLFLSFSNSFSYPCIQELTDYTSFGHINVYLSMALQSFCSTLDAFSVSWSYTLSVGILGREISQSQGLYLYTEQHKHRITHTDIHALNGIRTHDPSVRASEDTSCLRPRGHCDRHKRYSQFGNFRSLCTVPYLSRPIYENKTFNWNKLKWSS
jgi:hypothetical protein